LIVHGHPEISDQEVLRALDVGLTLLNVVRALPYERHVVIDANLPVFGDAGGGNRRDDVTAVLLGTDSAENGRRYSRAFPTTRTNFVPGQEVAWEWDMRNVWGESWYRDRDGNLKYGWRASAEFVGRPLDEL
jgi:hypothetical protein